jgi:hypothetical protein
LTTRAILLLAALCATFGSAVAQSDECTNPDAISGEGTWPIGEPATTTFTNICFTGLYEDLWFVWTPLVTGDYTISATSTPPSVETKRIHLGVGSDCNATCYGTTTAGTLRRGFEAGQQYVIRIGVIPADGELDPGELEIQFEPLLTENIFTCENARVISGQGPFVWEFDSVTSQLPTSEIAVSGSPTASPPTYGEPNGAACITGTFTPEATYLLWTPAATGSYYFSTHPGFPPANSAPYYPDSSLALYSGTDCSDLTCIGYNYYTDGFIGLNHAELWDVPLIAGEPVMIALQGAYDPTRYEGLLTITGPSSPCNETSRFTSSCFPITPHYQGGNVELGGTLQGCGTDDLHLEAFHGPDGEFGYFLMSMGAAQTIPAFQGVLCLSNPIGRYNDNAANNLGAPEMNSIGMFQAGSGQFVNVAGTSTVGTGYDVPSLLPNPPGPGTIQPGDSVFFQLWYRDRDPQGTPSSNFSNVLGVQMP